MKITYLLISDVYEAKQWRCTGAFQSSRLMVPQHWLSAHGHRTFSVAGPMTLIQSFARLDA